MPPTVTTARTTLPETTITGAAGALLVLIALSACRDDPVAPAPAPAAAPASSAAPASASAPAPASAAAPPVDKGPKRLTEDERKALRAYEKALERGRLATRKKDYPAAIAAFDEALVQQKNDARALAERGYARLLSDDLEVAAKDLDAAKGRVSDKDLSAQIWFNIGLVKERAGDEEGARLSFAISFEMKPTAAAKKKLSGKTFCPVRVDRDPGASPAVHKGWLAAWKAVAADYEKNNLSDADRPKDDEAAKVQFHVKECAGACIATVGEYGELAFYLVFPNADATLAFVEIGTGGVWRCSAGPSVSIADENPATEPLHVVYTRIDLEPGAACYNIGKPDEYCQFTCNPGSWLQQDIFFDRATRTRILMIEQTGLEEQSERTASAVKTSADGVTLNDGACDKNVPFKAP